MLCLRAALRGQGIFARVPNLSGRASSRAVPPQAPRHHSWHPRTLDEKWGLRCQPDCRWGRSDVAIVVWRPCSTLTASLCTPRIPHSPQSIPCCHSSSPPLRKQTVFLLSQCRSLQPSGGRRIGRPNSRSSAPTPTRPGQVAPFTATRSLATIATPVSFVRLVTRRN